MYPYPLPSGKRLPYEPYTTYEDLRHYFAQLDAGIFAARMTPEESTVDKKKREVLKAAMKMCDEKTMAPKDIDEYVTEGLKSARGAADDDDHQEAPDEYPDNLTICTEEAETIIESDEGGQNAYIATEQDDTGQQNLSVQYEFAPIDDFYARTERLAKWNRASILTTLDQIEQHITSEQAKEVIEAYRLHLDSELVRQGHGGALER